VTWLALDSRPPIWDYANHLERAVRCAADLAAGDIHSVLARSSFYPPLVPCTAGLAYLAVPSDTAAAQAVILGFLALGMLATYWLGSHYAGGPAGVVAAVLFGSAPFVVYLSVRFQLDLPLAALVAVTLAMLVKTEDFARRSWSVATGIVVALGMLTKPSFFVYVLAAIVVAAAGIRGRGRLGNAALAFFAALVLCAPWYSRRAFLIVPQILYRSTRPGIEEGDPEVFTLAGLAWYFEQLPMQLGWVAVGLLCVGLVVAVRRREWLLVASVLAPVALFVLARNKDLRYTLPVLPAAAVLAGIGFAILPVRWRRAAAALVVTAAVLQVSASAFGMPAGWRLPLLGAPLGIASPPVREDWRQRELLSLIERDAGGAPHTVSIVSNHPFFSVSNFRYYGARDDRPAQVVRVWENEPLGIEYMILKTGDVGPRWTTGKVLEVAQRLDRDPHLARVFPVLAERRLPDGSTATVRARRIPVALDTSSGELARAIEAAFRRRLEEFARDVDHLVVRLGFTDEIRRGRISSIIVEAGAATVGELERRNAPVLRVRDVRVIFEDVLVNPYSVVTDGRLAPLDVGGSAWSGPSSPARPWQPSWPGCDGRPS
jgi:Dolichyl-phosphate-mannose-protein mannosyltransferase